MIVELQLLGGIDLNEGNLEFILGNGDVKLMWYRTFYPHKRKDEMWTTIFVYNATTNEDR